MEGGRELFGQADGTEAGACACRACLASPGDAAGGSGRLWVRSKRHRQCQGTGVRSVVCPQNVSFFFWNWKYYNPSFDPFHLIVGN